MQYISPFNLKTINMEYLVKLEDRCDMVIVHFKLINADIVAQNLLLLRKLIELN